VHAGVVSRGGPRHAPRLAALLLLLPSLATGGVQGECAELCRAERRACAPALRACLGDARRAADAPRAARRACRADHHRCRTLAIRDCRRIVREPVVPENVGLATCPVTGKPACAELGPDEPCTDPLHPADAYFWDRFHAGDYGAIPEMLRRLHDGLAERPDDPSLARHVPWTHIWRLAELSRGTATADQLFESLRETRPGFARARLLNPDDPRVLGFLAGITLGEGIVLGDTTLVDEGAALFVESIAAWPEFNYFSSGYILSQLPRDDPGFQLGLAQQWANVDVCAGFVVDRMHPDLAATLARDTRAGRLRVCWNSWIAPFNLEGFFLNLGDMLVKDGQVATGVQVYAAARLADNYDRWPYRATLEQRIADAAENATRFNQDPPAAGHAIMFESPYSCMGCHQAQ
jgi:hypothetical protein